MRCSSAPRETATSVPVANAIARLRLLEGEPDAARDALAPHLEGDGGAAALGGVPVSTRAEAWLLDALALDALAETRALRARWSGRSIWPSPPGCDG